MYNINYLEIKQWRSEGGRAAPGGTFVGAAKMGLQKIF